MPSTKMFATCDSLHRTQDCVPYIDRPQCALYLSVNHVRILFRSPLGRWNSWYIFPMNHPNFLCIFQFDVVFVCALLWSLVLYVHPESLVVTGTRLQLSPRQDAKVSEQNPWMLRIVKCLQASNIASAIDVESWLQSSTIQLPPWLLDTGFFHSILHVNMCLFVQWQQYKITELRRAKQIP